MFDIFTVLDSTVKKNDFNQVDFETLKNVITKNQLTFREKRFIVSIYLITS